MPSSETKISSSPTSDKPAKSRERKRSDAASTDSAVPSTATADFTSASSISVPKPIPSAANYQDRAGEKDEYHGMIDGKMFMKWFENRLVPAFEAQYPGKKMILCLDNAAYHNPRPAGYKSPSAMTKDELVAKVTQWNLHSLLPPPTRRNPQWTKAILLPIIRSYLAANPHLAPRALSTAMAKKEGWWLLMTPPYEFEVQPIERVWGQVKGAVSRKYTVGRSLTETRAHLLDAFYTHIYDGGNKKHKGNAGGITARHCLGSICRSEQWMDRYIHQHPHLLHGTVDNLVFADSLLPQRTTTPNLNDNDAEWEEDEEGSDDEEEKEEEVEELQAADDESKAEAQAVVDEASKAAVQAMSSLRASQQWRALQGWGSRALTEAEAAALDQSVERRVDRAVELSSAADDVPEGAGSARSLLELMNSAAAAMGR